MNLLLDTTILIDALRHRLGRRELLAKTVREGHTLATTAINLAEIYAGMRPAEEAKTKMLLDGLECYPVTAAVACRAGRLKWEWSQKGRTLALDDMLIAAAALEHGLTLMTDNRMDFPMDELDLYSLP
ncbi:MAG: type II toxin-antitoxin system VapC family toxin [Acidobacteriaceae bacterium]